MSHREPDATNGEGRVPRDPEVVEKPRRRQFTAEYKKRILKEAEACREPEQGSYEVSFPARDVWTRWKSKPLTPPKPPGWITVEFRDELGAPLAHEPYLVRTDAGDELVGRLDGRGKAKLSDLTGERCRVSFPARDGRSWMTLARSS